MQTALVAWLGKNVGKIIFGGDILEPVHAVLEIANVKVLRQTYLLSSMTGPLL